MDLFIINHYVTNETSNEIFTISLYNNTKYSRVIIFYFYCTQFENTFISLPAAGFLEFLVNVRITVSLNTVSNKN